MKNFLFFLIVAALSTVVQAQTNLINGKVEHLGVPLENIQVSIIDTDVDTKTDSNGFYQISAKPRDVIQYRFPGFKNVQILVEDVTNTLNISMSQKVEMLDEVIVKGGKQKSERLLEQEYSVNQNLIKTRYGVLDSDTATGKIRFLNKDEINDIGICVLDVIRNNFPGVRVFGDCLSGGGVSLRGLNTGGQLLPVAYDVDGQVFSSVPKWISPSSITRIAVLNNLAMTLRYGAVGSGGVIVINTNALLNSEEIDGKPYDLALLRNNLYDNSALSLTDFDKDRPLYLKELLNANTEKEAMGIYGNQIKKYSSSYFYVLDAYNYFSNRWKNEEFAEMIIEENQKTLKDNPVALKSLAYIYQAEGKFSNANKLYEEIYVLRPDYTQSYLDLANSYRELGLNHKSAAMYLRYKLLIDEELLVSDVRVKELVNRDYNNLLALKGEELVSNDKVEHIKLYNDFKGTRLVFEWSDSEAEFELQFVNPDKRYEKSEHSLVADAERIQSEKRSGLSSEEYLIDDSLRGTWLVNAIYLGNKSLTPTYLKATIYYNYGSASQRKEVKVFKLSIRNLNQQLFTVSNASSIVSN